MAFYYYNVVISLVEKWMKITFSLIQNNSLIKLSIEEMQKISLISPEKIRNHLANSSPSRFVHSFSRSKRFASANPQCKEAFYSKSSELSQKKITIGNSKRFDFTKTTIESPASSAYLMKSEFQNMNKTFTFGVSREMSPERSILYSKLKTRVPGPGAYQNQRKTRMTICYSLRPKTVDVIAKHISYLENPGPGTYQSVQLNPHNGRFSLSQFSDSKLAVINRQARFKKRNEIIPSPAQYKTIDNFNDKGKYTLSHRRGKGTRPFDKERKFTVSYWKHSDAPGPGSYEKPSEFGIYGDSNYYKSLHLTS